MTRTVTVVAYHYVRDLERSRFPRIKARRTAEFVRQVALLRDRAITVEQLGEALRDRSVQLRDDAVLLTFDDGYADHHDVVVPVLHDAGVQGAFYVPVLPVVRRCVLQVNKIHFVLAVADEQELLHTVLAEIDRRGAEFALEPAAQLYARHSAPNRYDTAAVTFTKRMLQAVLPAPLRTGIVDDLFARYVTADERGFAEDLYMSTGQVRALAAAGHHIGGHGYSHSWMDTLHPAEQARETDRSVAFLTTLGVPGRGWTMAYPYGRSDPSLEGVVAARGCAAAFTVVPRVADLDVDGPLALPRLDTNDLPF